MKPTGFGIELGAMALALSLSAPSEGMVRVTTLSDTGGPTPGLLSCVGEAFPVEERAELGTNDSHAWLFVAKLESVPVAPHAVHLLLTVDEPEARKAQEDLGVPLRFLSWRSF